MPFMEHLAELRRVLLSVVIILLAGTAGALYFSGRILTFIIRLLPEEAPAHVSSPPEAFLIRLKVSAATALFVGTPVVIYQIWSFVAPARGSRPCSSCCDGRRWRSCCGCLRSRH